MVLTFKVLYLCEFHHLPEDTRFLIQFDGVQSARVAASSRAGIEVSLSWEEFALNVPSSVEEKLEVMQADLVLSSAGGVALQLGGFPSSGYSEFWMTVCIRAEWMKILRSDGVDLSLAQFLKMGGEYWDDFGKQPGE